jgi:hypothetical protein
MEVLRKTANNFKQGSLSFRQLYNVTNMTIAGQRFDEYVPAAENRGGIKDVAMKGDSYRPI